MMALGANMKGPVLYAVPVFCVILLSIIKRGWLWIPPLKILVKAGFLSLVLFLAVLTTASIHFATWEPLHMVWRENVLRFFGQYDHEGTFYTYFAKIFYLAAPWSLFLPVALIHSLKGSLRRVSQIPEVLILFGGIFLFFNLSGSRRPYYLLPILPFIAILVANMLREFKIGMMGRVIQAVIRGIGVLMGFALIGLFGISLLLSQIFSTNINTLWFVSILLAVAGLTLLVSAVKKYVWGMVGPLVAVWLIYVIVLIPWITEGPNLRTKVAEVNALGRPCGFLSMDDAKLLFYLDKPYQVFYDEARALHWATRAGGVLITSVDVSDQSWEGIVKGKNWQAVIPRKDFF
jgi:4-amino-4-deoxy-L-arabinose transferase-like glycosyltransferase